MRLRPLIINETCNPEWVSVPLVGWSHARALMDRTDAHLAVQVRNAPALVRAGLVEGRDFTSIDTEPLWGPIYRGANRLLGKGKGWTLSTALFVIAYPYFEQIIWKKLGRRIEAGEFDVVHRITPLTATAPSLIAMRCRRLGVPFVLGPLNGGVPWPPGFDKERRKEKEYLSYVRPVYKLVPGIESTRTAASAILIASRDTWSQFSPRHHKKMFYVPENAIDPARFSVRRTRGVATRPLKVIFVGRLVPYKGADMLLEAAAPLVRRGDVSLEIIGDGPAMADLKALVARENLGDAVSLPGWVQHQDVQKHLVDADLFAFPSVREFGGGVALEAMAVGLPPAVVDYGGPGELVTDRTGFRVPLGGRAQIVAGYRDLLERLVADPSQIDVRSGPAARRAHGQFTWAAKAEQDLRIYEWVMNPGSPRPAFPMPTPDLK